MTLPAPYDNLSWLDNSREVAPAVEVKQKHNDLEDVQHDTFDQRDERTARGANCNGIGGDCD